MREGARAAGQAPPNRVTATQEGTPGEAIPSEEIGEPEGGTEVLGEAETGGVPRSSLSPSGPAKPLRIG